MSDVLDVHVGDKAPEFALIDDLGREVALTDFLGFRVVLFFYVRNGGSGCVAQVQGFRSLFRDFRATNTVVLGIAPESVESNADFKVVEALPFTLLSDVDSRVARHYGCYGDRRIMGKQVTGVLRSHFVIDEEGLVLALNRKVGATDSASEALKVISKLER